MKKLLLTLGAIASVAAPVAAVVACGTTPAATHVDEGFNNASLIENFKISDEEDKTVTTTKMEISGKSYDTPEQFIGAWVKTINDLLTKDATATSDSDMVFPELKSYKGAKMTVTDLNKSENDYFELKLSDNTNPNVQTVHGKLNQFAEMVTHIFSFPSYYDDGKGNTRAGVAATGVEAGWAFKNIVFGSVDTVIKAAKNDSTDSILYTEANKLTNTIETTGDEIYIDPAKGLSGYYMRDDKTLDIQPFKVFDYNSPISAEVQPGDSMIFAFDDPTDIASFTQRVRYVTASADAGSTLLKNIKDESQIKPMEYKVEEGKLTAQTSGGFTLEAIANNAIKLTFKDIVDTKIDGQLIVLSGFQDANKDKKIDHTDISVINPFYITRPADQNYISDAPKKLITKEKFVFGHAAAKAQIESL